MGVGDFIGSIVGAANPAGAPASIAQAAQGIISMFKLDPNKKAQYQADFVAENIDLEKAELAANLATAQGQLAINLAEAQKGGLFNDWRDAVGWTCAIALFWNYVGQPFGVDILLACHRAIDITLIPKLDMTSLFTLLGTMLGTGASQFHLGGGDGH
jgi:hypothetical protein